MKCPVCGDEVVNGKCRFCGYEPTETDKKARERYESQKAAFESGRSDPEDNTRRSGRPPGEKKRRSSEKPESKESKPVKKPADEKPPAKKPTAKKSSSGSKRKRPGLLKRWFFKLLVFGWIILYILAVIGRLSKGPDFNKPEPDSDINNIGQVETWPGEGGAWDARE